MGADRCYRRRRGSVVDQLPDPYVALSAGKKLDLLSYAARGLVRPVSGVRSATPTGRRAGWTQRWQLPMTPAEREAFLRGPVGWRQPCGPDRR